MTDAEKITALEAQLSSQRAEILRDVSPYRYPETTEIDMLYVALAALDRLMGEK